jgi:hypothetical protein
VSRDVQGRVCGTEGGAAMIAENLFDSDDSLWKGMPEYKQEDQGPYFSVTIHFRNEEDVADFFKLINQRRTKRKSYWHPEAKFRRVADKIYMDTK